MSDARTSEQKSKSFGPRRGEVWKRPNSRGKGFVVSKPAETRHVVDRNLGGDVIYVSGRWSRHAYKQQCTLSEWLEWQHDAKRITPPRSKEWKATSK